jgi:hypothetical protein
MFCTVARPTIFDQSSGTLETVGASLRRAPIPKNFAPAFNDWREAKAPTKFWATFSYHCA